jgi:hypothetical protein
MLALLLTFFMVVPKREHYHLEGKLMAEYGQDFFMRKTRHTPHVCEDKPMYVIIP